MFSVDSNDVVGEFGRYTLSHFVNWEKCKMTLQYQRPGSKAVQLNDRTLTIKVNGYYKLFVSVNNSGNWDLGWVSLFLKKNDKTFLDG